jgi:hypothetical protein
MNEQYNIPPVQPPAMPVMPHNSTLAIISLIAGIAGWFLLPIIAPIAAVITGHMAKSEIKKSNGMVTGNGMATAGLVLGYIQLGLAVCGCIVYAGIMIWAAVQGNSSYSY